MGLLRVELRSDHSMFLVQKVIQSKRIRGQSRVRAVRVLPCCGIVTLFVDLEATR